MQKTLKLIRAFAREEDGVTAIEYALLAALIAVAIIVTVNLLSAQIQATFTNITNAMATANG
ncbi:Flp family type IVb pilin [Paraburkholderia sp. A2RI-6]|uniref:Flp family type IVb pilin n=1 Tax=Paraburkholderia sp. A2RI-6 TaxID=3028371 RepID=UPI003B8020D9